MTQTKSTHRTEVVRIQKEKHPNADSLSLVKPWGYQVVVRTADWDDGQLAAYVVPDSVVDTSRPEFAFLKKESRIKVRKFRGEWSQGLLVPAPAGAKEGDDVSDALGVTRYEPPLPGSAGRASLLTGGEAASPPPGVYPKYDLESWHRYKHIFLEGEEVEITEKLHGCSARYLFVNDQMYCGSRGEWKKEYPTYDHLTVDSLFPQLMKRKPKPGEEPLTEETARKEAQDLINRVHSKPVQKNLWWQALEQNSWIESWCRLNPGRCLYGEVFGQVQDLKYGAGRGQYFFRAFDILEDGKFLDINDAHAAARGVFWVPVLYRGPYSEAQVRVLASGPTTWTSAEHCREGIVIRPVIERWHGDCGRAVLKLVSDEYLERA